MEWMNRPNRPTNGSGQSSSPVNIGANQGPHQNGQRNNKEKSKVLSFHTVSSVVMLISITFLTLAVIGFIMNYRGKDESRFVATDKMQAVFINGGQQVYFGKIRELNNKYVGLTDIYYLRVNQQVQPKQGEEQAKQDISLVKLGCSELHKPQDQMIINRDQVVFWENLQSDSQVAKAVESYKQANPDGKCPEPQASQDSQSNQQQETTQNQQQNTTNQNTQNQNQ